MDVKEEAPSSPEPSEESQNNIKVLPQKRINNFRKAWLEQTDANGDYISEWCEQTHIPFTVRCMWCKRNLKFATKGFPAIRQHAQMVKHKQHREKIMVSTSASPPKRGLKRKAKETVEGVDGDDLDIPEKISCVDVDKASSSNKNCIVCNFPLRPCRYKLGTPTKLTETPAYEFLEYFTGTTLAEEIKSESEICFECFLMIEKFDELQQQCESIQVKIANFFHKTHSEQIYEPQDDLGEADECEAENGDVEETLEKLDSTDDEKVKEPEVDPKKYCEKCKKTFKTVNGLTVHLATDHGRIEGPVDCPVCQKTSRDVATLRCHILHHGADKKFLCGRCGANFTYKSSFDFHMMTHDDIRPFACDFPGCDRKFREPTKLKRHHQVHTGEKPFECPHCPNKTFSQRSSMNAHIKKHHEKAEESCEFCDVKVRTKEEMENHLAEVHNIEIKEADFLEEEDSD